MLDDLTTAEGTSLSTDAVPSETPVGAVGIPGLAAALLRRVAAGLRAAAFWTAALLPAAVLMGLLVEPLGRHLPALAGVLAFDAVCALVGHGHAPGG
ncbi:hypothetical protein [Natronomonas marina]|jgi:hypothetical protein|uniref:hypothetical protein n=1 Tax=Natronomonas marina TaxID=2961939 RepID=UPI0020C9E863|nr:hypothetical protein [Natronomonas marina]